MNGRECVMKKILLTLLSGTFLACSPIPELAGIIAVDISDGGSDMNMDGAVRMPPRRGGDMGFRSDMGFRDDMGTGEPPCPPIFGMVSSFCYWADGPGDLNFGTALAPATMDPGCTLATGKISVAAPATSCGMQFAQTVSDGWKFAPTKPVHLAFSYSIKSNQDHAILTVSMPVAMTDAIKVDGITGSGNVINLFVPKGSTFPPQFSMGVAGTLTKATLSFDWISVWQ